jgi:hypothetical protein
VSILRSIGTAKKEIKRTTLSYANNNRGSRFFESLYYMLPKKLDCFMSELSDFLFHRTGLLIDRFNGVLFQKHPPPSGF